MQLVAAALCLIMLIIVGAGVVTAKQEENPNLRQAGESSVYFYDVAATDTHGKGKLQIDMDEQTFVFNGQGFMPSQQYSLQATTVSGDPYVFATGKTTPSGNLHIEGVWEAAAAPASMAAAVGSSYTPIAGFALDNTAWFITRVACFYSTDGGVTWKESDHTGDIWAGDPIEFVPLETIGVPYGALVKIHAIVVAGNDRTGSTVFQFAPVHGDWKYAYYQVAGTTLTSKLYFIGYLEWVG